MINVTEVLTAAIRVILFEISHVEKQFSKKRAPPF
jgi:hypothetical protein